MVTPAVTEVSREGHKRQPAVKVDTRPLKLDSELRAWEREVYNADPTGGAASRY